MKQIKYISVLFIIAALVFTGCSNNVSAPQKNLKNDDGQVKGITITGGININANALPSQLQNVSSARMATAGSEGSFFINCPDSTVEAKNLTTGYTMTGGIYEVDTSKYAYRITLPGSGEWLIKVIAKAGEASYYGEAEVDIKYSNGPFGSGLVMQSSEPPSIVLSPLFKEGETGTINLKVKNQMPTAYSTDSYTVKMIWQNDIPETIKSQLVYDENDDIYYKTVTMQSTNNSESGVFNITNVPAGAYKVEIQFLNSNGKILYSCNQWIHVFGNMTTNSWYGIGAQYISDSNKTWLALTGRAVLEYERSQTKAYSEKSVLYKFNNNDDYDIQIISQNNYSDFFSAINAPDVILPDSLDILTNCFTNSYCYGKNNTVYIAGEIIDDEYYNMYHYIYEIQQDDVKQYYLFEDPDDQSDNRLESEIVGINYDESSGHLFIITAGKKLSYNNESSYFQKLFEVELNSSSNTAVIKSTYIIGQKNQQIVSFVVSNSFLYLSEFRENCVFLDIYLMEPGNNKLTQYVSKKLLDLSESKYKTNQIENHNVLINDIVFVNNSIFILLSDYYTDLFYTYCRGGVIKYDTFTKTCDDIAGFATTDTFGNIEVNFLCSSDNSTIIKTYPDQTFNESNQYYLGVFAYNYAPVDEDSEFYGPKKIISYDNSHLYITDSGIRILLDNQNKTSFENINRIAKFNIDYMVIEEIVSGVDPTVKFELQKDEIFTTGTEGYSLDNTVYDYNGETLDVGTKVYPYILKHQD